MAMDMGMDFTILTIGATRIMDIMDLLGGLVLDGAILIMEDTTAVTLVTPIMDIPITAMAMEVVTPTTPTPFPITEAEGILTTIELKLAAGPIMLLPEIHTAVPKIRVE